MIVENLSGYDKYVITLVYLFLVLLSHVIGCTAGGLLLYGTYKMNPKYILTWIIYAVVYAIFEIVAEIIGCNVSRNNHLGISIGVIVIVLVKTTFCVWVVYNYLKETQLSIEYAKCRRQLRLE
ncbi:unnamed protein product [Allacma fusca]|nr:unnamed protein product [Allacma fusca]